VVGASPNVVGTDQFRVEADGFGRVANGPVVVLQLPVKSGSLSVDPNVVRVEADGLSVVLNGPVVMPLGTMGPAPMEAGQGISWIETNRLSQFRNGLVVSSPADADDPPAVAMGKGMAIQSETDGFREVCNDPVLISFVGVGEAISTDLLLLHPLSRLQL